MLTELLYSTFGDFLARHDFVEIKDARLGLSIVLSSSAFNIRFSQDRGDVYVDIIPPLGGGEFYLAETILLLVGVPEDEFVGSEPAALSAMASAIDRSYDQIALLFSAERWKATRARLEELRLARMLRMFPNMTVVRKN